MYMIQNIGTKCPNCHYPFKTRQDVTPLTVYPRNGKTRYHLAVCEHCKHEIDTPCPTFSHKE